MDDLFSLHLLNRHHGRLKLLVNLQQLGRRRNPCVNNIIAKRNRKGLLADQMPGLVDGMPQPERLLLPDIAEVGQRMNPLQFLQ